jgi:predicted SnoaL-like aldol condensation-catalyzing enzyme
MLGQSVFFDVFRFDREQIVEHWGFSAPDTPDFPSSSEWKNENGYL